MLILNRILVVNIKIIKNRRLFFKHRWF